VPRSHRVIGFTSWLKKILAFWLCEVSPTFVHTKKQKQKQKEGGPKKIFFL
jgi:hypothetical protein